mmetsp:Transcript_11391/g.1706  ORF Transcript_11391/g.1706 Transcript_11391/m.1706 type:complete len:82 (+) Transcript_11391:553-798(+)
MFAKYYASPEAASAFARIYENTDGMKDKFIAYWNRTVSEFVDNEYVLGYDPINEPLSANMYKDINLLLPGKNDYKNLQPLY